MARCIAAVSLAGIAWAVYGVLARSTLCDPGPASGEVLLILPSTHRIVLTLAIAQMLVYSAWVGIAFLRRRRLSIKLEDALRRTAPDLCPSLCLLLLLGVFVPYIGPLYKLSTFLLGLGPVLAAVTLAVILVRAFKPRFDGVRLFKLMDGISVSVLGAILLAFVLAIYMLFTFRTVHLNAQKDKRYYLLTGDEPAYLLITHSLVFDRDFNLYNNINRKDSLVFWDREVHHEVFRNYPLRRGIAATAEYWSERRYAIFRLGLPLLLGPSYYLGYLCNHQVRLAVSLFLNLVTALLVWNVFHLTCVLLKPGSRTGPAVSEKTVAVVSSVFFALSMPVLFYSSKVFTEVPAALLIVYAFRKMMARDMHARDSFLTGLCLAFLPWLHDKFIAFSILLLVVFFAMARRSLGTAALVSFGVPLLVSAGLLMRYYYLLYGVIHPVSIYGDFSWRYLKNGFPGILLDQDHGLFPYSPFYFLALPGAVILWRRRRNDAGWLILLIVAYCMEIASFREWWGGFCPPGRFLLPVLGLCMPFIASGIYYHGRARWWYYVPGCVSIALGLFSMRFQGRLYRHLHPFIPYVDWINLRGVFPSMGSPNLHDYGLCAAWFVAILVCTIWAAGAGRQEGESFAC